MFLCSLRPGFLRRIQKCPSEIWTARACQFRSCSYLVVVACEDSSVVHTVLAVAFVHWRSQPMSASWRGGTGRGNAGASWECTAQVQSSRKKTKTLGGSARSHYQQVCLRSDEVHTKLRGSNRICNKATQPCLPDNVFWVIYAAVFWSFQAFLLVKTQLSIFKHFASEVISWISSVCIEVIWSKRFFKKRKCTQDENPLTFGSLCAQNRTKSRLKPLCGSESERG